MAYITGETSSHLQVDAERTTTAQGAGDAATTKHLRVLILVFEISSHVARL